MDRTRHTTIGTGHNRVLLLHGFLGSHRNLRSFARTWANQRPDLRLELVDLAEHGSAQPGPGTAGTGDLASEARSEAKPSGDGRPDLLRPGTGDLASEARSEAKPSGDGRPDLLRPGTEDLDLRGVASELLGFLEDRALHCRTIVGHSFGGRTALAAAQIAPDKFDTVVLLDISPGPLATPKDQAEVLSAFFSAPDRVPDRETMRRELKRRGVSEQTTEWLLTNLAPKEGVYVWRVDRSRLEELHRRSSVVDLWPVVEAKRQRVVCVFGERSSFVTKEDVRRCTELGVDVRMVPDSGHNVHMEQPAALAAILDELDIK